MAFHNNLAFTVLPSVFISTKTNESGSTSENVYDPLLSDVVVATTAVPFDFSSQIWTPASEGALNGNRNSLAPAVNTLGPKMKLAGVLSLSATMPSTSSSLSLLPFRYPGGLVP